MVQNNLLCKETIMYYLYALLPMQYGINNMSVRLICRSIEVRIHRAIFDENFNDTNETMICYQKSVIIYKKVNISS